MAGDARPYAEVMILQVEAEGLVERRATTPEATVDQEAGGYHRGGRGGRDIDVGDRLYRHAASP